MLCRKELYQQAVLGRRAALAFIEGDSMAKEWAQSFYKSRSWKLARMQAIRETSDGITDQHKRLCRPDL